MKTWNFPSDPVVKNLPSNAGDMQLYFHQAGQNVILNLVDSKHMLPFVSNSKYFV